MVDEQIGLEGGVELLEQAIGHRGAGKAELAHRTYVGLGEALVMNEVVIERRNEIEVCDLLGGDEFERLRDLEPCQACENAADQRHRQ